MTWEIEKVEVTVTCEGKRGVMTFTDGPSRSILRVLTQFAIEQIGSAVDHGVMWEDTNDQTQT